MRQWQLYPAKCRTIPAHNGQTESSETETDLLYSRERR